MTSTSALAAKADRQPSGKLADGTQIGTITLSNGQGVSARILTYRATLQSLVSPDRQGRQADVLLGYDDLAGYVDHPNYFGVTVGRYANRIAGGESTLDGQSCQLPLHDNGNTLHGGGKGFDKVAWKLVSLKSGPTASVVLSHSSPDGHSGYPGKLDTSVTYVLDENGALTISFEAKTNKPTIVNLTNHAIYNLGGEGSPEGALGHLLTIPAKSYTPVDANLIPRGEYKPVDGSAFDFRSPRGRRRHPRRARSADRLRARR